MDLGIGIKEVREPLQGRQYTPKCGGGLHRRETKKRGRRHKFACHPCRKPLLLPSVLFQLSTRRKSLLFYYRLRLQTTHAAQMGMPPPRMHSVQSENQDCFSHFKVEGDGGVTQLVDCLPSKHKALGPVSRTT